MRLYLVRHAAVTVQPEQPGAAWHLSPEGRAAAAALGAEPYWAGLAVVYTSPEPKAVATAQRIAAPHGLPIGIERDVREVERRGWAGDGYRELVQRYLAGEEIGWEPRPAALARVRAGVDGIVARHGAAAAGVVSHGIALTLYLADALALNAQAAFALWSGIAFPDVAVLDTETRRLERAFGG